MEDFASINLSPLDAARRQLECAISMWFADKDPVAIHTLAHAAHQIIADIHAIKCPEKEMFFDSSQIRDDKRKEFARLFKDAGWFFKHADREPDRILEFSPFISVIFLLYSIVGLRNLGEQLRVFETVFLNWLAIHHPQMVAPQFVEQINTVLDRSSVHYAAKFRTLRKKEFLQAALDADALRRLA